MGRWYVHLEGWQLTLNQAVKDGQASVDEFVSAWQGLAAAGPSSLLHSRKPSHASFCLSLPLSWGAPGDLSGAQSTCWSWLALSAPRACCSDSAVRLPDCSSRTGDPRDLFNWVLRFHLNHTAEELDLNPTNCLYVLVLLFSGP